MEEKQEEVCNSQMLRKATVNCIKNMSSGQESVLDHFLLSFISLKINPGMAK